MDLANQKAEWQQKNPKTWAECLEVGDKLLKTMPMDINQATQSKFTTYSDLEENNWRRVDVPRSEWSSSDIPESSYDSFRSSANCVRWEQKTGYGTFFNVYNAKAGIIYAQNNISPAHLENEPPGTGTGPKPPTLKYWSDVTYIEWSTQTIPTFEHPKAHPRKLKYVWRVNVVNQNTMDIVSEAFERTASSLQRSKIFSMQDEEGKAILGTPNGRGVAHLLIDHKHVTQFGRKEVVSVHAFIAKEPYPPHLHLVFEIQDVVV